MIIIEKYKLVPDKNDKSKFYVKSEEKSVCPLCSHSDLRVIGSRKRIALSSSSEKLSIVIRRLRCSKCSRIHHELPDMLVPYKRYSSACIEAIVESEGDGISCENSSIYRIKEWFGYMMVYIAGSLGAIAAKMGIEIEAKEKSPFQRIKVYVGKEKGWLARAVRTIANTNNWVHTRSAFMS
ncbi:MAG TPA: DUF6431 domain-containing protein [Methanomethylovorans sp.]|nr:DUF6431 domain-containing protein [Methanomethylovorans sp.]